MSKYNALSAEAALLADQCFNCSCKEPVCVHTQLGLTLESYSKFLLRHEKAIEALRKIAGADYRGNRSMESEIAFAALAEIGG